jgi:hypothetical protein
MTAMGSHQSARAGTVVWLTPPDILAKLGGPDSFDLDPCAAIDQPWRTAKHQFTEKDDGLAQDWRQFGRTWLNPPYTNSVIGTWLGRLGDHGDGIALIFARTETEVFHRQVWERCDALLFMEGRLYFHYPDGTRARANAGAPSVFCAYGPESADVLSQCDIPGAFVPLRLRAFAFGFDEPGSWVEEVRKVMERADRPMTVAQLYKCLADSPKAKRTNTARQKIRQTLQRGPFEPLGGGVWQLDLLAEAAVNG